MHLEKPKFLAKAIKHTLIRSLKINTSESEYDVTHYRSFGHFFARKLKAGLRPVASTPLVSPCDGKLVQCGKINGNQLIQSKGLSFSLQDFLGDESLCEPFLDGFFLTLYLAPHNYHRVHIPVKSELCLSRFQAGDLWPVNAQSVAAIPGLFCINERWISTFNSTLGAYAMVMVGATNVGSMEIHAVKDKEPEKLTSGEWLSYFEPPVKFEKGDEYGIFNMGSTVILLLSRDFLSRIDTSQCSTERSIRQGEALA